MAVQIPDPGTGNGQTGDNEYVFRSKVKSNFTDPDNAASKTVGFATGQLLLSEHAHYATYHRSPTKIDLTGVSIDDSGVLNGLRIQVTVTELTEMFGGTLPEQFDGAVYTLVTERTKSYFMQTLTEITSITHGRQWRRVRWGSWYPWKEILTTSSPIIYNTTTASGANVVVTANGVLQRSTSSERYKDILAPLELDDARYEDAMALKPIVYRSTADADNPAYHYYSFSAEELGAYDPAFTLWRETETITDADGNVTEQLLAERQAEGININALLAMSHAIAIKQGELIKGLQEQVNALKPKSEV